MSKYLLIGVLLCFGGLAALAYFDSWERIERRQEDRIRGFIGTHDCKLNVHYPPRSEFAASTGNVVMRRGMTIYSCVGIDGSLSLWDPKP